jgi:Glycosyl transferases group 1
VKVYIWAADNYGCGHHRAHWPAQVLQRAGHQVVVVPPQTRSLPIYTDRASGQIAHVSYPVDADVLVFQRLTDRRVVETFGWLRAHGLAVVVDVDDDLAAIHPANPAFEVMHPRRAAAGSPHSWRHLADACRQATMVTVSTPELLKRYAPHGRGRVVPNTLAAHYYGLPRRPPDAAATIGWPGNIYSHPDDPQATGGAVGRLVRAGHPFRVIGDPAGLGRPFGLDADPAGTGDVSLADWPATIATLLSIGLAPLADTRFNAAKSWLKPLELAACGVAWVGSPRVEYRRLHQLGCGLLAEGPRDWHRHLSRLLASPALRGELAEAGLQVAAQLKLADHAWRWWEAWADALALQRAGNPARPARRRVDPAQLAAGAQALAALQRGEPARELTTGRLPL